MKFSPFYCRELNPSDFLSVAEVRCIVSLLFDEIDGCVETLANEEPSLNAAMKKFLSWPEVRLLFRLAPRKMRRFRASVYNELRNYLCSEPMKLIASKTYNISTEKELKKAERYKMMLSNKCDKVTVLTVGLDRIKIEGFDKTR